MPKRTDDTTHRRAPVDEETTIVGGLGKALLAKTRERAHFIVLAGENVGCLFRIERRETIIGRAAEATIRLTDDGVSRRHARVLEEEGQVWIEDLKSANGTCVNGQPVLKTALRDGDKVEIGATTILKFSYSDELEEQFHAKMYEAALRDSLTQAYNKRHFLERLGVEIAYARRHSTALALLLLDIDHFKQVNDAHGHPAGDHVLAGLGRLVLGMLRTEDVFARYGGEEFAVICRGVSVANAATLAERLRSAVEAARFEHQQSRIPITVSIGVTALADATTDATRLIADADAALYEAKRTGRNRVVAR